MNVFPATSHHDIVKKSFIWWSLSKKNIYFQIIKKKKYDSVEKIWFGNFWMWFGRKKIWFIRKKSTKSSFYRNFVKTHMKNASKTQFLSLCPLRKWWMKNFKVSCTKSQQRWRGQSDASYKFLAIKSSHIVFFFFSNQKMSCNSTLRPNFEMYMKETVKFIQDLTELTVRSILVPANMDISMMIQ